MAAADYTTPVVGAEYGAAVSESQYTSYEEPTYSAATGVGTGSGITVKVRSLTGQTEPVPNVPPNGIVQDLKNRVQDVLGIPADIQRLILSGRELVDNQQGLEEAGVVNDVIVHLVVRSGPIGAAAEDPEKRGSYLATQSNGTFVAVNVAQDFGSSPGLGYGGTETTRFVAFSGEHIYETYRLARWVYFIAVIDIIISIINGIRFPLAFIGVPFALSGLIAARRYSRIFLLPYMLYQLAETAVYIFFLTIIFFVPFIFQIIVNVLVLWILIVFFRRLSKLTAEDRTQLLTFAGGYYY